MTKTERAIELFSQGAACSQAILVAFGGNSGLDESIAFRMTAGLGAGIGRTQMVCGAVNAGAMIVSLEEGNEHPEDRAGKERAAKKVADYMTELQTTYPDLTCAAMLGKRFASDQEWADAREAGLFSKVCVDAVRQVGTYLENREASK